MGCRRRLWRRGPIELGHLKVVVIARYDGDPVGMIVDLPLYGVEGISDGDVRIRMSFLVVVLIANRDLTPREGHIDPHMEQVALVMAPMKLLEHHASCGDPRMEPIQFVGFLADPGGDGV